jgi:hypothetical protein
MKKKSRYFFLLALMSQAVFAGALDQKSSEFIEYLLSFKVPQAPVVFDDAVIFTAPSVYKRVGIAFASENFEKIHWFVKLLVPIDDTAAFDPGNKIPPEMLRDSGVLFFAWTPRLENETAEYRMIIDGLWSADPLNKNKKADPLTGLELSVAPMPKTGLDAPHASYETKSLALSYRAPSGEIITVAGDFNDWDPFMYQMKETTPGRYTISIPLPEGEWRYVFFHRGRRVLDPDNLDRVYARNGMSANTIVLN